MHAVMQCMLQPSVKRNYWLHRLQYHVEYFDLRCVRGSPTPKPFVPCPTPFRTLGGYFHLLSYPSRTLTPTAAPLVLSIAHSYTNRGTSHTGYSYSCYPHIHRCTPSQMSGFEIAGAVLATPGIAQLLVCTAVQGCQIFQDAKLAGEGIQRCQVELDTHRLRLEDWIEEVNSFGGDLAALVGGRSNKRYTLILRTLVLITGLFAQVDQLESKYGIRRETPHGSRRARLKEMLLGSGQQNGRSGSTLTVPGRKHLKSRSTSSLPTPRKGLSSSTPPLDTVDLEQIVDCSRGLDLDYNVQGLEGFAESMERVAREYQETLSAYAQYKWVLSSQDKVRALISDLDKHITALEKLTRGNYRCALHHPPINSPLLISLTQFKNSS